MNSVEGNPSSIDSLRFQRHECRPLHTLNVKFIIMEKRIKNTLVT